MNYEAAKSYILNRLEEELPSSLYYHGMHHTMDVLSVAQELCRRENVAPRETTLVLTAALFHDAGFIFNHVNHEALSCDIARQALPRFGYSPADINRVCGMIMATKIPQSPQNHLEEILCDADLDYLGRDDFFTIATTLFMELRALKILEDEPTWNEIQLGFLENHHFFTSTSRQRRRKKKMLHLQEIRKRVAQHPS